MRQKRKPEKPSSFQQLIIGKFDGISPLHECFYFFMIEKFSENAIANFKRLEKIDVHDNLSDFIQVLWIAASSLAMVSKFFWPIEPATEIAKARSRSLRNIFCITDQNPLQDRGLRNSLEHIDERLDEFLAVDKRRRLGQNHTEFGLEVEINSLIDFNRERNDVSVLDNVFALTPLIDELDRVLRIAQQNQKSTGGESGIRY